MDSGAPPVANDTKQLPLPDDRNNVANNGKEVGNVGQAVANNTSDIGNGDQEVASYDANGPSAGNPSCSSA